MIELMQCIKNRRAGVLGMTKNAERWLRATEFSWVHPEVNTEVFKSRLDHSLIATATWFQPDKLVSQRSEQ